MCTLTHHSRVVNSVDFSPDGNSIVSGSVDYLVKIWNAEPGAEVSCFVGVRSEWGGGCAVRGVLACIVVEVV